MDGRPRGARQDNREAKRVATHDRMRTRRPARRARTQAVNREQKLAVVIGFAVVLVVAVLITDHYSNVQQSQLDVGPMLRVEPLETVARSGHEPPLPQGWALDVTMPQAQLRAVAQNQVQLQDPSQPDRVATRPTPADSGQNDPVEIRIGRTPSTSAGTLEADQAGNDLFESIRRLGDSVIEVLPELPVAGRVDEVTPRRSPTTPITALLPEYLPGRAPEQVLTPTTREYLVEPNDSLFKIAKRFYGDGMLWQQLAHANKGKIGAKGTIRPGVRLVLPARLGTLGLRDPRNSPAPTPPAARTPKAPATVSGPKLGTYTVVKGDTLGGISQKLLGSSKRMNEILNANRGVLNNADEIRVGMKLKIPGGSPVRSSSKTTPEPTPASASKPKMYTVVKGDTLGAISQRLLGSSKRMDEILEANRGVLDDADELLVGMKLKIPQR